jgi:hypothetical protein
VPDSARVEFPNGAVLEIRVAKEGDAVADAQVGGAYWAVVKGESSAERWRRGWGVALVWVIPCLVLYALGWAIAWVRRGFQSEDPRGPMRK